MKRASILLGAIIAVLLVYNTLLPPEESISFLVPTKTAVTTATLTPSPTTTQIPSPTATPIFDQSKNGTMESDITYCIVDGNRLKMDVYFPQTADGLWPVAVYIHGGSFTGGSKQSGAGIPFIQPLVNSGYLVVAVNYRLLPEYPFPAPIEDVKCAIRSLRANASRFNIDVNRIGVFGSSAGGQLASLLGVMDASAGMDGSGGYFEQSSRVQAVVSMAGPSDVTLLCSPEGFLDLIDVQGCQDTETLLKYSPISYVSLDDPPFLLLHGTLDIGVPPVHSELLFERLNAAGIPVTYSRIQNAAHVFTPEGGEIQPSLEELVYLVISFFNDVMG